MTDLGINPITEDEKVSRPDEAIVPLKKPFVDGRGAIQSLFGQMRNPVANSLSHFRLLKLFNQA